MSESFVEVDADHQQPAAQPPEELTGLKATAPATAAAGIPAVLHSMLRVWREMGLTRGVRALLRLNQPGGIDCMSCAWADPDEGRSMAEFCENGAKALSWEADTDRVTADFFRTHSLAALAEQSDYWLGQQGRLTEPMWLRPGGSHYEPISWDSAFALIAQELHTLASPDEAVFYTSGRASNEAAFLYQLFVRQFGTNNLPDCSNMCHESSGSALSPTLGIGKGTVKLSDFDEAEVIVILGQNPGTNHPRMLTALQRAKRKGCRIIAVNPLKEAGLIAFKNPQEAAGLLGFATPLTDLYLQVRIGGDMALLKGLMKLLLEAEDRRPGTVLNGKFIAENTVGFEALAADIRAADWQTLVEQSGIPRTEMQQAADMLIGAERIIACWAMGLTQHADAVGTIQQVVNLLLMRGSIGKPGAGACPVRGHSNVQGDRTVGIWERPPEAFLDKLREVFDFEPPRKFGFDVVESIYAMHDGRAKVFFALGGNFISATPDTEYTAEALRRCALTVQVSTKLNRSHLVTGRQALILPCLGRSDVDLQNGGPQFVSCENTMGVVQSSQGSLQPPSEQCWSEPAIVARLARAVLGDKTTVPWDALAVDYDCIRELIEKVVPGFENYNRRVRQSGGFYLPNAPREGHFPTDVGKASFTVHALPDYRLEAGQLVLTTIRTHDQFNTTVYGLNDRYRGVHNERRVIFMHADDLRERGLAGGDIVDITSHFHGATRVARRFIAVPYDIPRGCTASYFPETNVLVPIDSVATTSNTPTSKYVVITVQRAEEA